MRRGVVLVALLATGCAHPQHVLVVSDQAVYETLSDIHATEQMALCGQLSCAGQPDNPVAGWTHDKSVQFNIKLLPAVQAGRQLNLVLAQWRDGQPIPQEIRTLVNAIASALSAVVVSFPDGTTKTRILTDLASVQKIVLGILDAFLSATSPTSFVPTIPAVPPTIYQLN